VYGLGHSEEVVGRAVKSSAHKPYIFTKCSMRWHADRSIYNSLKPHRAEEVEASLRRLQVEAIDLYQIHWPNPDSEIEEDGRRSTAFASKASCAGSAYPISMLTR